MAKSKAQTLKEQAEVHTIGQPDTNPAAETVAYSKENPRPKAQSVSAKNLKVAKIGSVLQPQAINRTAITQLDGEEIISMTQDGEEPPEAVTFLAENKSLQLYVEDYEIHEIDGELHKVPIPTDNNKQALKKIRFAQGTFRTNNPITIHQIRTAEMNGKQLLGRTVYEGMLPEYIITRQKKYTEFFTKDPQEHELRTDIY